MVIIIIIVIKILWFHTVIWY